MTPALLTECIEEAAEYGDRFPDKSEFEVLEHVTFVMQLSDALRPEWAISRAILRAYEMASVGEGLKCAKVWRLV